MAPVERVELEAAYVLHRRAYRDTSALVELLTADYGRVGVVARGVRGRRTTGQAGLLQPFQPLRVSWYSRGELGTLTGAEAAAGPTVLTGERLVAGFYANELLLRLLVRQQPHAVTFGSYAALLSQLAGDAPMGPSLRVFERDLLTDLGYGLSLTSDTEGQPVVAEHWYRYDLEHGPVRAASADGPGLRVPGRALLALAQDQPTAEDDGKLKPLMRAALRLYLGDRPLKSRELYASYRGTRRNDVKDTSDD